MKLMSLPNKLVKAGIRHTVLIKAGTAIHNWLFANLKLEL